MIQYGLRFFRQVGEYRGGHYQEQVFEIGKIPEHKYDPDRKCHQYEKKTYPAAFQVLHPLCDMQQFGQVFHELAGIAPHKVEAGKE